MYTVFEWDDAKAETNHRKHNVRFEEAATVFHDPFIANICQTQITLPPQRSA